MLQMRWVRVAAIGALAISPMAILTGATFHNAPVLHCTAEALPGNASAAQVANYNPHLQCFGSAPAALKSLGVKPMRRVSTNVMPPITRSAGDPPGQEGRNCIAQAEAGSGPVGAPSGYRCFQTFAEAIHAATGGAVTLAAGTTPSQLTQSMLDVPSTSTVIGVDYMDSGFYGGSLTWSESSDIYGCTDGSYYAAPTIPSGWNDDVSSARSYGGCATYNHFENTYYGGSKLTCTCSTMGVMNDQTSSEKWYN